MSKTDQLFETTQYGTGEFRFDENVASVFDDMITRSVPLYAEVQEFTPRLIGNLTHNPTHTPIRLVDLGCSTGTTFQVIGQALPELSMQWIGIDASEEMLNRCRKKLAQRPPHHDLSLTCGKIQDVDFDSASVVFLNYTLQFLPVAQRPQLLKKIYQSLRPGGFLLMSEKFVYADPVLNETVQQAYFDYKKSKGYSDLEIARKRDALEDVLVPSSVPDNLKMLGAAGFPDPQLLLKWFNFGTFLCYK